MVMKKSEREEKVAMSAFQLEEEKKFWLQFV